MSGNNWPCKGLPVPMDCSKPRTGSRETRGEAAGVTQVSGHQEAIRIAVCSLQACAEGGQRSDTESKETF